jgi:hypothetical protein
VARNFSHQIVVAFREEVRERIDPLHRNLLVKCLLERRPGVSEVGQDNARIQGLLNRFAHGSSLEAYS